LNQPRLLGDLNETGRRQYKRAADSPWCPDHDNGPARPGWLVAAAAGRNLDRAQRPASCRRCPAAVQEPAGPRSPARASAWRPSPAAAGAV